MSETGKLLPQLAYKFVLQSLRKSNAFVFTGGWVQCYVQFYGEKIKSIIPAAHLEFLWSGKYCTELNTTKSKDNSIPPPLLPP